MAFDPVATAGLETREVLTGSRDGVTTKIAVASRTYPTPQADLWDAVTNAERIPRWFLPVTGDLKLGGRYQLIGNAGGVVEVCEPNERFAVTWEMQGMVSWVEIALTRVGDGTRLELRHEAPFNEEFWTQFGPGAVGVGWDMGLMGLGMHFESDAAVDPSIADEWSVSPDGIAFVRAAASGWANAAIADGDDPDAAREAAERTVTFYTVVPDSTH